MLCLENNLIKKIGEGARSGGGDNDEEEDVGKETRTVSCVTLDLLRVSYKHANANN